MASESLTGWTPAEREQARIDHPDDYRLDFEELYCLSVISRQPPEYEGPDRYCKKYCRNPDDVDYRWDHCRFHGSGPETPDSPETQFKEGNTARLKHGMYSEDANLKENFSEADEALYDQIMSWAEDYGFEEGSPEHLQLESLALSKVRSMRSEKYLNENGEIIVDEEFDPQSGQMIENERTHPLKGDLRLQKKTILDMMKELGLTPKAKSQMDGGDAGVSAVDALSEMAQDAVSDGDYNPDDFEN